MVPDVLTSCLNFAREIKQIFRLAECPMPLFISMILAYAYSSVQRLHSDSYSSILSVLYLQYHAESTSFFFFSFFVGGNHPHHRTSSDHWKRYYLGFHQYVLNLPEFFAIDPVYHKKVIFCSRRQVTKRDLEHFEKSSCDAEQTCFRRFCHLIKLPNLCY